MKTPIPIVLLTAALVLAPRANATRIMVSGDSRGSFPEEGVNAPILQELAHQAVVQGVDMILFTGDLSYLGDLAGTKKWKMAWQEVYENGIPTYFVRGNHEMGEPEIYEQEIARFMPRNGPASEQGLTYFLAHDDTLIIGLDEYTHPDRIDFEWLESVLATNKLPHIIAFGHEPAFAVVHWDCLDDIPSTRNRLWSTLASHGSHFYFCGHDHFFDDLVADDGDGKPSNDMHQLIMGTGGAPLYGDGFYDGDNEPYNPQRAFHENNYGYAIVETDRLQGTFTWFSRSDSGTYDGRHSWSYTAQPTLQSTVSMDGQTIHISFPTVPNVTYTVEQSDDLTSWDTTVVFVAIERNATIDIPTEQNGCRMFRVSADQ